MSSQAPRADERLPLVSQRREQHQQLGGGELSRLSTSMAIGAVVVEVQTEEELAVQAAFAVMSTRITEEISKKASFCVLKASFSGRARRGAPVGTKQVAEHPADLRNIRRDRRPPYCGRVFGAEHRAPPGPFWAQPRPKPPTTRPPGAGGAVWGPD